MAAAVAAIADSRVSFPLPSLSLSRSLSLSLPRYSPSLFLFPSICIPPSFRYSPNYPFSSFPVVFLLTRFPTTSNHDSLLLCCTSAQCLEGIHIVLSVFYDLHLVQTRRNVVPHDATTCQHLHRVLTIYRCNNTWNLTAQHCSLKISCVFPFILYYLLFLFFIPYNGFFLLFLRLFFFFFFITPQSFTNIVRAIITLFRYVFRCTYIELHVQLRKTSNVLIINSCTILKTLT